MGGGIRKCDAIHISTYSKLHMTRGLDPSVRGMILCRCQGCFVMLQGDSHRHVLLGCHLTLLRRVAILVFSKSYCLFGLDCQNAKKNRTITNLSGEVEYFSIEAFYSRVARDLLEVAEGFLPSVSSLLMYVCKQTHILQLVANKQGGKLKGQ